jgi:hypothetical protein
MGRSLFGIFHVTPDAHICSPRGVVAATKRSCCQVLQGERRARLRVGEQLKRARNGCIGAQQKCCGASRRSLFFHGLPGIENT